MNRFFVFPRKRRGEFRYGIVNEFGRELGSIANEEDARSIVRIMNTNNLTPERVAAVEILSREKGVRTEHLQAVMTARKYRTA